MLSTYYLMINGGSIQGMKSGRNTSVANSLHLLHVVWSTYFLMIRRQ